jgi:hypothetical protein
MGLPTFGRGITPIRKGAYTHSEGGLHPFGRGLTGVYPRGLKCVDYFYQIK